MNRIEATLFSDFMMMLIVAGMSGGSEDVVYVKGDSSSRYVATLGLSKGDRVALIVRLPCGQRIAAYTSWHSDETWHYMASYGVQSVDCPTPIWAGSARWFRTENLPEERLPFEDALKQHDDSNPGTTITSDFMVPG